MGGLVEIALATAAFAVFCVLVLTVAPQTAEPDDGAYRASIVGITDGQFLTLSAAQAETLAGSLGDNPAAPPNQWVELKDGRYISEKDPGYPFLAAPFQRLGIIRLAPLFFGALACLGLFLGGTRWLGKVGGLAAVGLYCSSGAALAFAWRDYMPTFTDTSLVATGIGLLLWAVLATEASLRRRTWVGLSGFLALEAATFVRYTDIVILACATVVVAVAWRLPATQLTLRTLCWWLGSAAGCVVGILLFNDLVYGGPLTSGYQPGEVTFARSAIRPNLRIMPAHLGQAMPMLLLALIALAWIIVRWAMVRRLHGQHAARARPDLFVGAALAAAWFAIWGLYLTYTWTTDSTNVTVQDVRFYLPAIGAISLLAAWLTTRRPGRIGRPLLSVCVIAALFGLGAWTFHAMYAAFGIRLHS